jgi:hypothetical protein
MSADDCESRAGDHRAMDFLRQARELRGLSPAAIARIERSLERGVDTALARPRPRTMRFATVSAAVVLLAGATFTVAHVGWRNLPVVGPLFAPPARSHAPSLLQTAVAPSSASEQATPAQATSSPEPSPSLEAAAAREPAPAQVEAKPNAPASGKKVTMRSLGDGTAAHAVATPEAAVDPILAESQSFAAVIQRWHRDHDGSGALAALDAHERRFPSGRLLVEARVLRAEILLAQGLERESLVLLDHMSLAGSPRARELLTVRGELRIKLGRCADGRADLDEVLSKGVADGLAKRATQALRHCP